MWSRMIPILFSGLELLIYLTVPPMFWDLQTGATLPSGLIFVYSARLSYTLMLCWSLHCSTFFFSSFDDWKVVLIFVPCDELYCV